MHRIAPIGRVRAAAATSPAPPGRQRSRARGLAGVRDSGRSSV